jgi:hypothetical protein
VVGGAFVLEALVLVPVLASGGVGLPGLWKLSLFNVEFGSAKFLAPPIVLTFMWLVLYGALLWFKKCGSRWMYEGEMLSVREPSAGLAPAASYSSAPFWAEMLCFYLVQARPRHGVGPFGHLAPLAAAVATSGWR